HLHLDDFPDHLGSPPVAHVSLGPPALSWSTDDLADRDFLDRAYPILKGHIHAAQLNTRGRSMGYSEPVSWVRGVWVCWPLPPEYRVPAALRPTTDLPTVDGRRARGSR